MRQKKDLYYCKCNRDISFSCFKGGFWGEFTKIKTVFLPPLGVFYCILNLYYDML